MNNFEKIKQMNIDEMAEVFKQFSYILLTRTADIVNVALGDKTPDIPLELFNNLII